MVKEILVVTLDILAFVKSPTRAAILIIRRFLDTPVTKEIKNSGRALVLQAGLKDIPITLPTTNVILKLAIRVVVLLMAMHM